MSHGRDFSEDSIRKLLEIVFFKDSTVVGPTLRIFCDVGQSTPGDSLTYASTNT
jgi:hypothetical protein